MIMPDLSLHEKVEFESMDDDSTSASSCDLNPSAATQRDSAPHLHDNKGTENKPCMRTNHAMNSSFTFDSKRSPPSSRRSTDSTPTATASSVQQPPATAAASPAACVAIPQVESTLSVAELERNLFLLPSFCFLLGLAFLSPFFVIYLKSQLDHSATIVAWVIAAQTASSFVMELPSGLLADLVGRKYCLMCSLLMRLIGLSIFALVHSIAPSLSVTQRFYGFVCAGAFEGAAQAMGSGTDIALLHDSLRALNRLSEFQSYLAFRSMMWPCAACIANLVGSTLSSYVSIDSCIYLTIVSTLLAVPSTALLKEVYPRVYDPFRVWRKRKERRLSEIALAATAAATAASSLPNTLSHHKLYPLAQPKSVRTESDLLRLLNAEAEAAERNQNSPSTDVPSTSSSPSTPATVPSNSSTPSQPSSAPTPPNGSFATQGTISHVFSPNSAETQLLRPTMLIVSTAQDACAHPVPCPSPLSVMPPHSFSNFFSLLATHVKACFATLSYSSNLQSLLLISSTLYAFSEPIHRLRGVYFASHGIDSKHFGLIGALMFGLSSAGSYLSSKLQRVKWIKLTDRQMMLLCTVVPPLLNWISSYSEGIATAVWLLPISFQWGIRLPLLSHLLHLELHSSNQRATVASLQSLLNKLALSICLTCIAGPITDATSIDTTVRVFACLSFLPFIWMIVWIDSDSSKPSKAQDAKLELEQDKKSKKEN